ncbi:hypothetical protein PXW86_26640, partial [Klebsiella pneumoniae]
VSVFLAHQRPADAVPLQLLRLIAREPHAGQQVGQRGLRVFLVCGCRERVRVAQNVQQARRCLAGTEKS